MVRRTLLAIALSGCGRTDAWPERAPGGGGGGGGDGGGGGGGFDAGAGGPCDEGEARPCGTDVGRCEYGMQRCEDGRFGPCRGEVPPLGEICNGLDDDCNGLTDETPCGGEPCDSPADADLCEDDVTAADGACLEVGGAIVEDCNGVDDDCDGAVDEGCCTPGEFALETIDDSGDVAGESSVAVDAGGSVHVAYADGSSGDLLYARRDPDGAWTIETVDSAGSVGWDASIAIDSIGTPHVAYADGTNDVLKHALDPATGGDWTTDTVDEDDPNGAQTAIAIGPSDEIRILYTGGGVRYAFGGPATGWTVEQAWDGSSPPDVALAQDASAGVHASWVDPSNDDLLYAWRSELGEYVWTVETAGDVGFSFGGVSTSIGVESSGVVDVVYHELDSGDFMLASRTTDGAWSTTALLTSGTTGQYPALAVGADDAVHVAFYDPAGFGSGSLVYGVRAAPGADFTFFTVDDDGDTGLYPALAVDAGGVVHVTYFDPSGFGSGDLRYARGCP